MTKCCICRKLITDKKRTVHCSVLCHLKHRSQKALNREHETGNNKRRRLKLRFDILMRDHFTCQYCGRKAPDVILQIDHKYPIARGGKNEMKNYITACSDCNIGKRDIILDEFKQKET